MPFRPGSTAGVGVFLAAPMLALLTLAGCAAEPQVDQVARYEQYVARWIEESEANLVAAWGIPDSSHAMETGGRIIEYTQRREGQLNCTTRFTIDSFGRVQKSWYRGNRCLAPDGA